MINKENQELNSKQDGIIDFILINELNKDEINIFSNILSSIFDESFGENYSVEESDILKDFTKENKILSRINNENNIILMAKYNNEIIGILEIHKNDHVPFYYIKNEFHYIKSKVAKKLLQYYLNLIK
jgi:hypothetical protein